ncbi:XPG/Rad2 endonuclease [Trema orientale]|uniref:XPG/Rad2 endonuclease n=1 Tax=Trema orientale TaxID=63057 RepID=A0A2P5BTC5_TREOI|nr:XPG/Rad2 endonuclease [Trema orientale]
MKLKEIADDIKNQRQKQKNDDKGRKVLPDQANLVGNDFGKKDVSSINCNQEELDEMLAASIMAEEGESLANNSTMSISSPCEEDGYEDEEMILPDMHGEVDAAVLAALTPSLQRDLLNQKQKQNNDDKGKKIMSDKARDDDMSSSCNQEKLDEMLAASLMEEENRSLSNKASTSAAPCPVEEDDDMDEDEDGDEEMILPAMDGEVDPSILAALPPSMQLDLLVQIRERSMAENRQKYQKVKKDPARFSELQIDAYLKTVAFRREIDQVQKVASGRGVGGVQTSRLASEANREFIFSSSFTGDKRVLAPARANKYGDKQRVEDPSSVMHAAVSTSKSNNVTGSKPDDSRRVFDDNIETYRDERGRLRVSRVRAMGIRMTRDLQRNLDLMKEIENERQNADKNFIETSHDGAESIKLKDTNEDSVLKNDASMEISFEDDGDIKCFDGDDEIFARLVAENPLKVSSDNIMTSRNLSDASDSNPLWEEDTTEAKDKSFSNDVYFRTENPYEGNNSDDSEVEWEEGVCKVNKPTPSESKKVLSKGNLEEEADLQEAIRRSLEDLDDQKSNSVLPEDEKLGVPERYACEGNRFLDPKDKVEGPVFPEDDGCQQNRSTCEILDGVENMDDVGLLSISGTTDSSGMLLKSSVAHDPDNSRILVELPREVHIGSPLEQPLQDATKRANLSEEVPDAGSVTPSKAKEVNVVGEGLLCTTSNEVGGFSTSFNKFAKDSPHTSVLCNDVPDGWVDDRKIATEAEPSCPLVQMTTPAVRSLKAVTNELIRNIEIDKNLTAQKGHEDCFQEIEHSLQNPALENNEDFHTEVTEASLEEEMRILGQERMDLGDEQRRLERNAESVSGEMFTECQELLQMFGLPYIIAPMEAEAQCAYMELANLVDGVVTDDSDVFLFGARSVYKNIFDDRKYVETYFMKDIEKDLGLTRQQLIRMALLLGSDYTEGISGIGIVNAIEVVHAFPEEDGLQKFRDWIESPDPTILGKFDTQTDSNARKKVPKIGDNANSSKINMEEEPASNENISEAQEQKQSADHIQDIRKVFMDKHSKYRKKSTPKKSRKRKISRDGVASESQELSEGRQDTNRKSYVTGSSRGRWRGRIAGRGKAKGNPTFEFYKSSSSDDDNDEDNDDAEEVQVETPERPLEVRRSSRLRKPVNYTANDSEIDDLDKLIDLNDKKCFDGEASKQDLSGGQDRCENADSSISQENKHNIENLSPSKRLDDDYLEKGGGFCPDNGENDRPGVSQHGDSHLEVEFSEEYFKTGGGFCVEECETGPDNNSTSRRVSSAGLESTDLSHCSGLGSADAFVSKVTVDQVNPTVNVDQSRSGMLLQDNDRDNTQTTPVGALCAMPYLRKRRRKS